MSYYDEASFVFLPQAAAGKGPQNGGEAFVLKPVEEVSETELIQNNDFSIDCTSTGNQLQEDVYGAWGWNFSTYGATTATTTIVNGVMTMTTPATVGVSSLGNPTGVNLTYATNASNDRNILTETALYKLTYTVVSKKHTNGGVDQFKGYWSGTYHNIPFEEGTHSVYMDHDGSNSLFLFRLHDLDDFIVIDNVSIRKVVNRSFDFPFQRDSNLAATRVNRGGLVEKGTENLFTHSNGFDNSVWSGSGFQVASTPGGVGITPGQPDYQGGNNAWRFLKNSGSGSDYFVGLFNGLTTFSIYVKKEAGTGVSLYSFYGVNPADNSNVGHRRATYSLEDGSQIYVSPAAVASSIQAVGDDWWRVSISADEGAQRFYLYTTDLNSNQGPEDLVPMPITIKDAQAEIGIYPSAYMHSTEQRGKGGVNSQSPRYDYSSGGCPQLLLETTRTNRVTYSENYGNVDWNAQTSGGIRTFKSNEKNPTGNYGCYEWHQVAVGGGEKLGIVCAGAPTIGEVATNSVYVKRVSGTGNVDLVDANNVYTSFSLSESDGWKRLEVTSAVTGTPSLSRRHYLKMQTAGDKILVWGSQYEEGSGAYGYATSYIPTNGSITTRTQDTCNTDDNINLADDDFTVFLDIEEYKNGGTGFWSFDYANGGNALFQYNNCIGWWSAAGAGQEIYQCNAFPTPNGNTKNKFLISSNAEEVKIYRDGSLIKHETSLVDSTRYGLKRVKLLYGAENSAKYNSVLVFPKVLSNHESEILSGATSYDSYEVMSTENNYTTYV